METKNGYWSKKIRCVETGVVYNSIKECSKKMGINHMTISNSANGKIKTTKCGYHFEFIHDSTADVVEDTIENVDEIWRVCVGFEDYEVSNLGRVRNIHTKRILNTHIYSGNNGHRYRTVYLSNANTRETSRHVSQLVFRAFGNDNLGNHVIIYKDGDFNNCSIDNLDLVDRSTYYSRMRVFNNSKRIRCVETGDVYNSMRQCALALGCSISHIHDCVKGKIEKLKNGMHVEFVS